MGYELIFHYAEQNEDGEYDKENLKTKKVKVGTPYEEIGLEYVAGKIMAQLARRSVLVMDVEVFEFAKKQISYKETPTGIKLKNQVFRFEDGATLEAAPSNSEEEKDAQKQLLDLLQSNPQLASYLNNSNKPAPPSPNGERILRHEYYTPTDKALIQETARRGYKMTYGNKYPVFAERKTEDAMGLFYIIKDDSGRKISLHASYFSPTLGVLKNEGNEPSGDIELDWNSTINDEIPDLRR